MRGPHTSAAFWALPLALSLLGLVITGMTGSWVGIVLSFGANAFLLARAHADVHARMTLPGAPRRLSLGFSLVGAGLVLGAAALLDASAPANFRRVLVVAMTSGAQIYLIGHAIDPTHGANARSRLLLPSLGHGIILLASSIFAMEPAISESTIALGYFTGFSMILLHAYWVNLDWSDPRLRGRTTGREVVFLLALGASLLLLGLDSSLQIGARLSDSRLTELVGRGGFVVALALLLHPPALGRIETTPGGLRQFLTQALVVVLILNALLLSVVLLSGWLATAFYVVLTLWLFIAVLFEYTTTLHGVLRRVRRRKDPTVPPTVGSGPITVVVSARNDATVLASSLERNLALPLPLRFLLVVSTASKDDTLEVAQRFARLHPDRVRVWNATSGSKAEDLNAAWGEVHTDLVLLLDADEVVRADALAWGIARLQADPAVGVVQGRKASGHGSDTWAARFARSERRFSAVLDQTAQSDVFGAAHFAGSVALMRREVPLDVGGWRPESLTEDIDFTMRVHLDHRWLIVYEPRMLADESDPVSFRALVRQRTRWARGWGEVYGLHFTSILASARRIGIRRALGLSWQLITSVSAPWSVFLPALGLLAMLGRTPGLTPAIGITLALLILPSRLIAFGTAALLDPLILTRRERVKESAIAIVTGYGWIVFGWLIQLHALYLEISAAPRTWYGTRRVKASATEASEVGA